MMKQLETLPSHPDWVFPSLRRQEVLWWCYATIKRSSAALKCQRVYTKQTLASYRVTQRVLGTCMHTFTLGCSLKRIIKIQQSTHHQLLVIPVVCFIIKY